MKTPDRGPVPSNRDRRLRADRRFRLYGRLAIATTLALLGLMIGTIVLHAIPAVTQTTISLVFPVSRDLVDPSNPSRGNFRRISQLAVARLFPEAATPAERRAQTAILTGNMAVLLRDAVLADPSVIGGDLTLRIPASDPFDQLRKGFIDRSSPESSRRISDAQIGWFDRLAAEGRVGQQFNTTLFLAQDSRFPETAGLAGAFSGTVRMLLVCLAVSVPAGIAAGIRLEEFSGRGWFSTIIEVNTNNLAAVPSILFGLLGLFILIKTLGLPGSTPLIGGLVLGLMTLPRIIIVTRAALRAVPAGLRDAAHGIGASRHQVVLHHVLPLALPTIVTGAALALTRALGEAAPLLLIGMNAFVPGPTTGLMVPTATLPTLIYAWAGIPEAGFLPRAAAALLVLLCFLGAINLAATLLSRLLDSRL